MLNIRMLEKSHAICILITLLKHGELSFSELIAKSGSNIGTTNDRIGELKSAGLIAEQFEKKFHGCRLISLTNKGQIVTNFLLMSDEALSDSSKYSECIDICGPLINKEESKS